MPIRPEDVHIAKKNQSCPGFPYFIFLYFVGNSCSNRYFHIEKSFGTHDVITARAVMQKQLEL